MHAASRAFFNEFSLISHQINSFNQFVGCRDCLIEIVMKPSYDPSKGKIGGWKLATIIYEKVRLEKPFFWIERNDREEEYLKLLHKHAQLSNMTYSSKLKLEVRMQVYILEKSEKVKISKNPYTCRKELGDDEKEIVIESLPVMMKLKQR